MEKGTLILSGSDDQHIAITDPFSGKVQYQITCLICIIVMYHLNFFMHSNILLSNAASTI